MLFFENFVDYDIDCSKKNCKIDFNYFSQNHLTALPREICHLPLQTLLVAHNRIASLPEELGRMSVLVEFDAGNNVIKALPSNLKDLMRLKYLNLRSNLLATIPIGR